MYTSNRNQGTNGNNAYNALDMAEYFVSVMSLILAMQNLQENREQSAHNDVQSANDQQADFLLNKLDERFEKQEHLLQEILEAVKSK